MEQNKDNQQPLMVTIRCIAYNQEKYIRDCLEGFVMQKTNFRFEAVVHDDASTDGTAVIIKEYAEKYPDIIKPILETENKYSKHDGSLQRIMEEACKGKDVAFCEGDDYWTDPLKLQKQVDFLESHPDCSLCFHNAIMHWEDGRAEDALFSHVENRTYTGVEVFQNWIVPTASVVIRYNEAYKGWRRKAAENKHFCYGDILCFLSASKCGKLCGMSDIMSVYRKQEGGAVYSYSVKRQLRQAYHSLEIYKFFGNEFKKLSIQKFAQNGLEAFWNMKGQGQIDYRLLWDLFLHAPLQVLASVCNKTITKFHNHGRR